VKCPLAVFALGQKKGNGRFPGRRARLCEKRRRSALLSGAIVGDPAPCVGLRRDRCVLHDSREHGRSSRWRERGKDDHAQRGRRVRALLTDCVCAFSVRRLSRRHGAMMLAAPATACRKACLCAACSEEAGDKRQQKEQQHRNGEPAAHRSSDFENTPMGAALCLTFVSSIRS
jgi:hypothetical protein